MPNGPVPAAAQGLPSLSRRSALMGAALIMPPARALAGSVEHAEIVSAGAALVQAVSSFEQARQQKVLARANYELMAPAVPKCLIASRADRFHGLAEDERDPEGRTLYPPPGSPTPRPRGIITAAHLSLAVDEHGAQSGLGDYALRLLAKAQRHEALIAKARDESGLDNAMEVEFRAKRELETLALAIADLPARTTRGLRIKALALGAYAAIDVDCRYRGSVLSGPALAEAVLAIIPAQ